MEFFWGVGRVIFEKETVIRRGSHKDLGGCSRQGNYKGEGPEVRMR